MGINPSYSDGLRRDAKKLLKDLRSGDQAALKRFVDQDIQSLINAFIPGDFRKRAKLKHAQLVIAKEHGFNTWEEMTSGIDNNVQATIEIRERLHGLYKHLHSLVADYREKGFELDRLRDSIVRAGGIELYIGEATTSVDKDDAGSLMREIEPLTKGRVSHGHIHTSIDLLGYDVKHVRESLPKAEGQPYYLEAADLVGKLDAVASEITDTAFTIGELEVKLITDHSGFELYFQQGPNNTPEAYVIKNVLVAFRYTEINVKNVISRCRSAHVGDHLKEYEIVQGIRAICHSLDPERGWKEIFNDLPQEFADLRHELRRKDVTQQMKEINISAVRPVEEKDPYSYQDQPGAHFCRELLGGTIKHLEADLSFIFKTQAQHPQASLWRLNNVERAIWEVKNHLTSRVEGGQDRLAGDLSLLVQTFDQESSGVEFGFQLQQDQVQSEELLSRLSSFMEHSRTLVSGLNEILKLDKSLIISECGDALKELKNKSGKVIAFVIGEAGTLSRHFDFEREKKLVGLLRRDGFFINCSDFEVLWGLRRLQFDMGEYNPWDYEDDHQWVVINKLGEELSTVELQPATFPKAEQCWRYGGWHEREVYKLPMDPVAKKATLYLIERHREAERRPDQLEVSAMLTMI